MLSRKIKESFLEGQAILADFILKDKNLEIIEKGCRLLADCFIEEGKVLICGNGGSMCDAMHFAEELTGRFRKNRPALPAISLSDASHISCVANDFGFEEIFARGVEAYGRKGDVFIGLSTSGNSANIIRACQVAKTKGLSTILLLGKDGGELKGQADLELIINGKTSDRIQEIHMFILHVLVEGIERLLFAQNYQ